MILLKLKLSFKSLAEEILRPQRDAPPLREQPVVITSHLRYANISYRESGRMGLSVPHGT